MSEVLRKYLPEEAIERACALLTEIIQPHFPHGIAQVSEAEVDRGTTAFLKRCEAEIIKPNLPHAMSVVRKETDRVDEGVFSQKEVAAVADSKRDPPS